MSITYLLHRSVEWQDALFEELLHHFIILCLDFRDHVTRNQTYSVSDLCLIEAICVFIAKDLKEEETSIRWTDTRRPVTAVD